MKKYFILKWGLYILLCAYASSPSASLNNHLTDYLMTKRVMYSKGVQKGTLESKQFSVQDILFYQSNPHYYHPLFDIPPELVENMNLESIMNMDTDQIAGLKLKPKTTIEINRCDNSSYFQISQETKELMREILQMAQIPFNCNGFFMDSKQTVKMKIAANQKITGMFFNKPGGVLHYMSFPNGYIYELPTEYAQPLQEFNKEVNTLYHAGRITILGYRITNPHLEAHEISDQDIQYYNKLVDTAVASEKPLMTYQTLSQVNTRVMHLYGDDDDDEPYPFPFPVPGVGKERPASDLIPFEHGRYNISSGRSAIIKQIYPLAWRGDDDDDEPYPFPFPVPGVGKQDRNPIMNSGFYISKGPFLFPPVQEIYGYYETDPLNTHAGKITIETIPPPYLISIVWGGDDDEPYPFPFPVPGVGKQDTQYPASTISFTK